MCEDKLAVYIEIDRMVDDNTTPPAFADLLKSATVDLLKSAGRNTHPHPHLCRISQICWQKYPPP